MTSTSDSSTRIGPPAGGAPPAAAICPICAAAATRYCDKHTYDQTWHVERCTACGHGFVSNRPSLERLGHIYATDTSHLEWDPANVSPEAHERRADCRALIGRAASLTRERGASLDVGCGDGGFSYHLAKHGFTSDMIDFDPRAQTVAKLVKNSTFRLCSFEEFTDDAARQSPPRRFSAIVMSQVLEHALDPIDWLRRAAGALSDGGVLAVAVPNFGGVYRMLGPRDPFIHPPIHLNFFTPASLRLAMEASGLRVRRMDSRSHLDLGRRPGAKGLIRRGVQAALNGTTWILNSGVHGVILRAYASRAAAGDSVRSTAPGGA